MAPSGFKDGSSGDHKQDLSTILTTEERVELTLLIANIAEVMRKQVADTFDATVDSGKSRRPIVQVQDTNPIETDTKKDNEEEEKARELRQKREKELSAPKMLELKTDSLAFFDKWRESVDSRVGQVVNTSKVVTEQQKEKASVDATPATAPTEPKILRKGFLSLFGGFHSGIIII